jgi:diphosphomevalonate decarboxylase
MSVTAIAHPNIALLKYWGKQPGDDNIPAVPSLSLTLDGLQTQTSVQPAARDCFVLNGSETTDPKIAGALRIWRQTCDIPPIHVETTNNFPTAAGLASSASGFAALITAIDACMDLQLSPAVRSGMARQGSGSAARSIFGGFVSLRGPAWQAQTLAPPEHWPLKVLIAITSEERKGTSSTEGMLHSEGTSPYYPTWVAATKAGHQPMREAILARDFTALADQAEASCLMMHSVMMSSRPGLIYWSPATLACIHEVRTLRQAGLKAFFTVDAGPQVKVICDSESIAQVEARLAALPGVLKTLKCGLGGDATVCE